MDQKFDAREFLERINKGLLDGRLNEELEKLSGDELTTLANLIAEQIAKKKPE